MTQRKSQHPRTPGLAIGTDDWCRRAKVDLQFLAWPGLDAAKGKWCLGLNLSNESPDAVVATCVAMLHSEILVDPLDRQSGIQPSKNLLALGFARTRRSRCGS